MVAIFSFYDENNVQGKRPHCAPVFGKTETNFAQVMATFEGGRAELDDMS